ncbi:uncharacterized protein LOC127853912 [Dreissena polymorpha]|uniref:Uncharacterized protein n=1 Tax=Dreissena polymorpha TaxID=45954 RepID=A0A9D4HNR2_DREPO|nr:uncharacterized protein LOC127853912 [Dreissena polymorpha]KAH3725320.1 hypothetical protein DPMN_051154 [Dreissena polymorpha]
MNSVLLMTDNWQPTVLRIVPFSSNIARNKERNAPGKRLHNSRGFPLLAVTRTENVNSETSSANSEIRSESKSVNSVRSDANIEPDASSVYSDANQSSVTRKTSSSLTKGHRKYPKKKIPVVHSEMKEAIKFSVQDINDQLSSTSSFTSSENKDENKEKVSRVDNTRTKLPKPSYGTLPEYRTHCSPVNGVRRSVPLTPGELELQRIRDSYYVEQVHRRKKFKLNVNQLPRSTTPINDHDPDKLNMKQVIAFLQAKTSKDIQKKILSEKRKDIGSGNVRVHDKLKPPEISVTNAPVPMKVYSKDNIKPLSRSNSDIKQTDKPDMQAIEQMRRTPGCVSVMSVKSTPNMPHNKRHKDQASKTHSSMSMRSMKEQRSIDSHSEKQRHMKEFKLFRFLAMTPDEASQSTSSGRSVTPRAFDKLRVKSDTQSPRGSSVETPRNMLSRRSRESGTAQVLHRHVLNRATLTPPKVDVKDVAISSNSHSSKTIRLPVVSDSGRDSPDDETCSTTSATYNSTKNEEGGTLPKKGKPPTIEGQLSESDPHNKDHGMTLRNGYRTGNYHVKGSAAPSFTRVYVPGPKHIHISIPQESKKTYSHEIVRLTLRQEKSTTRVTSYMSDIQHDRNNEASEDDPDNRHAPIRTEYPEWAEQSKLQHLHEQNVVNGDNCVKVRQKVPGSGLFNNG